MAPLRVRVSLATGITQAASRGIALDGLLAAQVWAERKAARRKAGQRSPGLLKVDEPRDLPLRRLGAPEHLLLVSHMLDAHRLEDGRVTWLRRGWPHVYEDLARVLPRLRGYV